MRRVTLGALAVLLVAARPLAPIGSPPPSASAAQVAREVNLSTRIATLPSSVAAGLPAASRDWWTVPYPSASSCGAVGQCVFGDRHATRTVVLFGDSHAAMWLPAVAPAAAALRIRLVLVFKELCPPATLVSFSYSGELPTPGCAAFRASTIVALHRLRPAAVLVGEQTAEVFGTARLQPFSDQAWAAALAITLRELKGPATKVAVLEDVPYFDSSPPWCLSAFPDDVQRCSIPDPNPSHPGFEDAESQATRATGSTLIRTTQWLCRTRCSPVVGRYVPYVDASHLGATYAAHLRGVMTTALRNLLA